MEASTLKSLRNLDVRVSALEQYLVFKYLKLRLYGGERGIRTPDRAFRPYNGLANRRLQPLGHLSVSIANYTGIRTWAFESAWLASE
jgi:hypothetical protein